MENHKIFQTAAKTSCNFCIHWYIIGLSKRGSRDASGPAREKLKERTIMKKKLLSLALVLVMALTLLPTAAFATDGADNLDGTPETTDPQQTGTPSDTTGSSGTTTSCTHATKTKVDEIPATCINPGTAEHWVCANPSCDGQNLVFLSDTADASLVDASTLVISATGVHNWGSDGKCTTPGCTAENTSTTPDPTPSACNHVATGGTLAVERAAVAPTCKTEGSKAYYKCSKCGYYFIDGAFNNPLLAVSVEALKVPATGRHVPPASSAFTIDKITSTHHTYDCTTCDTKGISEPHTPNSSGVCTVCGFQGAVTPSYRYLDITSAYVNSYSISVTWYSDLPDGTYFDIYVDSNFRRTVNPSKSSSGHFSATVDYSYYLDESYYNITVYARDNHSIYDSVRAYNRYYDHDYDYWYPNSTPSTNSYGIPYASQVNGRYSASEAIRILRNKNQYNLQNDLMSSSSALDSFERLESAVKSANSVYVNIDVDRSGVPSALRSGSGIQISGAAFNASRTNSTVRLVVDGPSVNRYAGRGYQFSMTLTGVDSASSLDVPVVVSMPLPSDISASYVKVLHYHNSSVPTVITPKVSGGRISFPLTGFSDFVVTDGGVPNYTYVSDGYGGYYVPVGNVARRSLIDEHLSVVLPIIASTAPNGYVYDDVSGTYWAAPQIAWARDGGLMTGYYDGTFRPYAGTTRQELWMVLARLSGANPADMWAAREWAMNVGITDGTNPQSPLSNQQMITMLYRYASYRRMNLTAPTTMLSIYHDGASVSPYARTAMAWAINQGIVTGNGTGYLNPQNIATRADFAVYLYRFLQ